MYLNFKKANPNVEVVMTIGNNDPISSKDKYAPENPDDKRNSIEIPQEEAFDGLIADIEREKPDAIIVIKQIYLDGAPLFDEKGEAIEPNRKISCAFDNFIPTDGRSEILQNANKEDVIIGGKKLRIDDTLIYQLKSAQGKYEKGATYPKFELVETID